MAFQSVWYYTDLPEDIIDIIERDVSETFDEQMGDSKLHGDALNKDKGTHRMLDSNDSSSVVSVALYPTQTVRTL